jgi:hypothetical protein
VLIRNFGPEQKIKMVGGENYMKTSRPRTWCDKMKKLEVQAANIGEVIQVKGVYKIFVQTIPRRRGDTQRRSRWEMKAF